MHKAPLEPEPEGSEGLSHAAVCGRARAEALMWRRIWMLKEQQGGQWDWTGGSTGLHG